MRLRNALSVFVLTGMLFTLTNSTACFTSQQLTNPFPQILGGTNGETEFSCVLFDESQAKVYGVGFSKSASDVVSLSQVPIVVQYDANTGAVGWHSQVLNSLLASVKPTRFSQCSMQYGAGNNYLVALSPSPQYGIFVFDKLSGSLVAGLYEQEFLTLSLLLTRSPIGLHVTDQHVLYLLSSLNQDLYLSQVDISDLTFSITSPNYYVKVTATASTLSTFAGAFLEALDTNYDAIFVSASVAGQYGLMKFKASDGSNEWVYTLTDTTGNFGQALMKFSGGFMDSTEYHHIGCAENVGASNSDIEFIHILSQNGGQPGIKHSWYFQFAQRRSCLGVRVQDSASAQILFARDLSYVYYGVLSLTDTSATSLSVKQIGLATSAADGFYPRKALFISLGLFYFVGETSYLNSQLFVQKVAILTQYPNPSCSPDTVTTILQDILAVTSFALVSGSISPSIFIASTTNLSNQDVWVDYMKSSGLSRSNLLSTTRYTLPPECYSYPNQGTITAGSQTVNATVAYVIADPALVLPISNFTYSQSCSDIVWRHNASFSNGTALNSVVITFTETSTGGIITVECSNPDYAGTYDVSYQGTIMNSGLNLKLTFQLTVILPPAPASPPPAPLANDTTNSTTNSTDSAVTNATTGNSTNATSPSNTTNHNTTIAQTVQAPTEYERTVITMEAGQKYQFLLKEIMSSGQIANISLLFVSGIPSFIQVSPTMLTFTPDGKDIGIYYIQVTCLNSAELMILLEVTRRSNVIPASIVAAINQTVNSTPTAYDVTNKTPIVTRRDFKMQIQSVSVDGKVVVFFTKEILVPGNWVEFHQGKELKLSITDSYGAEQVQSWTITDFTSQQFTAQLIFSQPLAVSGRGYAVLSITVLDNQKFISLMTLTPIPSGTVALKSVPKQIKSEEDKILVESVSNTASALITGIVVTTITLNLFLMMSLQELWGMINTMQLVLHIPLMSLSIPGNALLFFQSLISIVTFNVIDVSAYLQEIFFLKDQEEYPAYNDYFDMLGYSTTNSVYNIGLPIFFILFYLVLLVMYLLCSVLAHFITRFPKIQNAIAFLKDKLFFNAPMRFIIELTLEGAFSILPQFIVQLRDSPELTLGDWITLIFSGLLLTLVPIVALAVGYLLVKFRGGYYQEWTAQYANEISENQKTLYFAQIMYQPIFILRRLIFVAIVFSLEGEGALQLLLFIALNLGYVMYILYYRPIWGETRVEVFNELCALSISVIALLYTEILNNDELINYDVGGFGFIGIFSFNMAVNLILIMKANLRALFLQLKRRYRCIMRKISSKVKKSQSMQGERKHLKHHKLLMDLAEEGSYEQGTQREWWQQQREQLDMTGTHSFIDSQPMRFNMSAIQEERKSNGKRISRNTSISRDNRSFEKAHYNQISFESGTKRSLLKQGNSNSPDLSPSRYFSSPETVLRKNQTNHQLQQMMYPSFSIMVKETERLDPISNNASVEIQQEHPIAKYPTPNNLLSYNNCAPPKIQDIKLIQQKVKRPILLRKKSSRLFRPRIKGGGRIKSDSKKHVFDISGSPSVKLAKQQKAKALQEEELKILTPAFDNERYEDFSASVVPANVPIELKTQISLEYIQPAAAPIAKSDRMRRLQDMVRRELQDAD